MTDEQLVARYVKTNNKEIIGVLYERYTHLLFTVSYKYLGNDADAEDTVMLVFEKLFEILGKSDIVNFKNWIYTITRNECLMRLRRSLEEFVIGGIDTTVPLHRRIIGEQAFIDGDYDIHWLEKLVGLKK